jgi:hypothetical protein
VITTFTSRFVSITVTDSTMKALCRLTFLLFLFVFLGCATDDDSPGISILSSNFDFSQDIQGWNYGFAEYPAGPDDSTYYELKFGYGTDPAGAKAIMLSGNNRNSTLFMFLKRKVSDLTPNTIYTLTFNVTFIPNGATEGLTATQIASEDNVFLKVGATAIEPKAVIDRDRFVMNIDKGVLDESGNDMVTVGDIHSPSGPAMPITKTNSTYTDFPLRVKSNSKGELWLIVGTDSGATGKTTLFYSKVFVTLSATK